MPPIEPPPRPNPGNSSPQRPTRPQRPSPPAPAQGNWLGLLLALGAGLIIFVALAFLTGGFLALVVVVAGGVFALAALHYLVWGWWLSKLLYEEEAAENARREQDALDGQSPPDDGRPEDDSAA